MGRNGSRTDGGDLADALARRLTESGLTLAVAESCTGGLIAKRLTDRPGASLFFLGGVVAYDNKVKEAVLGVGSDMLESYGAVSRQVAVEMVEGVRRALGSDASLAVTGIAGPGGATADKPVGTVWIAAAIDGEVTTVVHELFAGDRETVRERASQAAMALLHGMLGARAG